MLGGAVQTLRRFRPRLMVELAPYVYAGQLHEFDGMLELLWELGYRLSDVARGTVLPRDAAGVRAMIAPGAGMNVLAEPE